MVANIFNLNFFLILAEIIVFNHVGGDKAGQASDLSARTAAGVRVLSRREKMFLALSFVQSSLIICLRDPTVGVDSDTYLRIYHMAISGSKLGYLEWGMRLYLRVLVGLRLSDAGFLSAFALPTMFLFYRFIRRCSPDVYLSVYIFTGFMFYFQMFNMVRQSLALAIALQGVEHAEKKNWARFVLTVAAAASFHTSALVFLLVAVLPAMRFKLSYGLFALTAALCAACLLFGGTAVRLLVGAFPRYEVYMTNARYAGSGNILNPLMYLCILLIITALWHGPADRMDHLLFNMMVVGTLIFFISRRVQIVNRLPYYFVSAIMAMLPRTLCRLQIPQTKRIAVCGCYAAVSIYEVLLVLRNAQGILPYKAFFM